jgi:predicted DNA-binding ribbon-helix-helix protein
MAKMTPHKSVRIDQDTYDELVKIAKDMRVSVTWLINNILRKAVDKNDE